MKAKKFLIKYVTDKIIAPLFFGGVIVFGIWWFFIRESNFLRFNTTLANCTLFVLCLPILIYEGIMRMRRLVPAVLDCISGFKTKTIKFYVENVFTEHLDIKNKTYYEEIQARTSNGKKVYCFRDSTTCSEIVKKGLYYTATVTKYSNTIIEVKQGKEF